MKLNGNPPISPDSGVGPIRTCIGCRQRRSAEELVRFARAVDGSIVADRRLAGRGAWLCADTLDACRAAAERRNAFARAFRLHE